MHDLYFMTEEMSWQAYILQQIAPKKYIIYNRALASARSPSSVFFVAAPTLRARAAALYRSSKWVSSLGPKGRECWWSYLLSFQKCVSQRLLNIKKPVISENSDFCSLFKACWNSRFVTKICTNIGILKDTINNYNYKPPNFYENRHIWKNLCDVKKCLTLVVVAKTIQDSLKIIIVCETKNHKMRA